MTHIIRLAPHDPIPSQTGRHIVVLHRFDEDSPRATITTITLTGTLAGRAKESARATRPDSQPMTLDQAIEAATKVAESENLDCIYVLDRTEGEREHTILAHGGDHSIDGDKLIDSDLEDGERGPDMRDRDF